MFGFFRKKSVVEGLKKEVQESFDHVKKDFNKIGEWINHLDGKHENHQKEIDSLKNHILEIQRDLTEIKDAVSFFGSGINRVLSKQPQTERDKQTVAVDVQTPVQTAVQTSILDKLTVMERAIVWALINSEMRLSYEDLATILGKDKSTIRGQINAIKQKSESLIGEMREVNGKKRLYVPEEVRDKILKSVKVRIRDKNKKNKG